MKKFIIKIKMIWAILTEFNHLVILNVNEKSLIELLEDKDEFDVDIMYAGLQPYVMYKMIKRISETKSDIDMALDKAQFEAEAQIKYGKKWD